VLAQACCHSLLQLIKSFFGLLIPRECIFFQQLCKGTCNDAITLNEFVVITNEPKNPHIALTA
jgi:hypothetical protein